MSCARAAPCRRKAETFELKENSSTSVDAVQSQAAATHMWLLNSNQCQPLPIDQEGVDQGVKRFFDNDPYYPCPLAATGITGEGLWELFANRYLENVGNIIGADQECRVLPNDFISKVVEAMRIRWEGKAQAAKRWDVYSLLLRKRGQIHRSNARKQQ